MGLHSIYPRNSGFSLIEVLICLSIMGMLSISITGLGLNGMRRHFFNTDIETTVQLLKSARTRSIKNTQNKPWGIRLQDHKVIIFNGESYNPSEKSNTVTDLSVSPVSSQYYEIVFNPITGAIPIPMIIELSDGKNTATIYVNEQGVINP